MTAPRPPRGLLVVLEGIDGSGKSTLLRALAHRWRRRGYRVALRREPANRRIGHEAERRGRDAPLASALYFTVDRALARPGLEAELARGTVVLQDRSFYSTLAYQAGALLERDRKVVEQWQRHVALRPDRVLWLDLPVPAALARLGGRGRARAPLERRAVLVRVRREYARLASGPRWIRLDARLPPGRLVELADARLVPLLRRRLGPGRRAS